MGAPGTGEITLTEFTSGVAGYLYSAATYPFLAEALQSLYEGIRLAQPATLGAAPGTAPAGAAGAAEAAEAAREALAALTGAAGRGLVDQRPGPAVRAANPDDPYAGDNSALAVNCTDEPFPRDPLRYPPTADRWELRSPTVGRTHAFSQVACASWPVAHPKRYSGPFDRHTRTPVLLFGNYHDPATNYRFSQRMAAELGSARLVGVDAFGHTIVGGQSACVDAATARYLVELAVPARGTVCQPDRQPFD
jgi:hypothetical protein